MPQRVQALVFRLALIGDARRDLGGIEALIDDDKPGLYASAGAGEHEIKLAFRADELPLALRMDDHRRQRHRALAGLRLGRPDFVERIRPLAHLQIATLEVDVGPAQAAHLA